MPTSAEIRNQAAKRLGVLGVGQTLQSEISADLDQAYTEVYDQLAAKNLVTWDSDESIPDEYAPHVTALVAYARSTNYGVPQERFIRIAADAANALPEIRELQADDVYSAKAVYY